MFSGASGWPVDTFSFVCTKMFKHLNELPTDLRVERFNLTMQICSFPVTAGGTVAAPHAPFPGSAETFWVSSILGLHPALGEQGLGIAMWVWLWGVNICPLTLGRDARPPTSSVFALEPACSSQPCPTLSVPPWACWLCRGGRWLWDSPLLAWPLLCCVVWATVLPLGDFIWNVTRVRSNTVKSLHSVPDTQHALAGANCCNSAALCPSYNSACGVSMQNAY